MPGYITSDDVALYLGQLQGNDPDVQAVLQPIVDRAISIVELELGFSFGDYPAAASDKTVYGEGLPSLYLPPHEAGTVTAVELEDGDAVTGWVEDEDGSLHLGSTTTWSFHWRSVWAPGKRYVVTAKWGAGPASDALKEVTIELAVNMWREKERGMFSDVIGVEGEGSVGVGYARAWTNRQRATLDMIRRSYEPSATGIL